MKLKHKIAIVICLATTTSLLLAQSWDFNNGSTAGLTVSNGGVHTGNGTGRSGYNFTGTSLSMYGSGNRYITLPAANTSNGGTLTFKLIYGMAVKIQICPQMKRCAYHILQIMDRLGQ